MSVTEHTTNLHHPRPTVARVLPSNPSAVLPSIQYLPTPVQRPHAPAPKSPDVRVIHNGSTSGHAFTHGEPNVWKNQPSIPTPERHNSTSPTVTRRSARSGSDATSPTYVDEHVITYPTVPPAVLRQRSASSPEQTKTGTSAYHGPASSSASRANAATAPVIKPRVLKTNSGNVHFTPDNLFVSLTSSHSLEIYNLTPSNNGPNPIMEATRSDVVTAWPAGIRSDSEGRGQWTVRFNTNIWSTRGQEGVIAGKMITTLFSILAVQGYSYLCSIQNTGLLQAPRHLFTSSPPSPTHFFSMTFSLRKNKLRFVDAPHDLNVAISNALKHATLFDVEEVDEEDLPSPPVPNPENEGDSDSDEETETHRVYTYRLTKRITVPRSKKDVSLFLTRSAKADMLLLLSQILKTIASFGYRLDASVPLGRVGLFGLRGRREMWIFKSVHWKV